MNTTENTTTIDEDSFFAVVEAVMDAGFLPPDSVNDYPEYSDLTWIEDRDFDAFRVEPNGLVTVVRQSDDVLVVVCTRNLVIHAEVRFPLTEAGLNLLRKALS